MELGIMTNVFRDRRLTKRNADYIEQMNLAADSGFRVLDLNVCDSARAGKNDDLSFDDWEARIDALGNAAAKRGVRFSQAHAPFDGSLFIKGKSPDEAYIATYREMTRRAVIAAGQLGIKWVIIHPLTDTIRTEYDNEIQLKTNLDFYAEYIELARKCGTGLAIENMAEFESTPSRRRFGVNVDDLLSFVDAVNDDDVVGICWDFGHGRVMFGNQSRQLRRIGSHLKATHVHDNRGERDSHLIPFVGGNIKWEEIMPVLREISYGGDFILETHKFMSNIPDELRLSAGKLAYEFGMYCMELYNK